MKAQVINQFGNHSVFETTELPRPVIKPGHVLIKVFATSVNPVDFKLRAGDFAQIVADFPAVLHGDVAGIIDEIGEGVTGFSVGDEVYGCAGGLKGKSASLHAVFMLLPMLAHINREHHGRILTQVAKLVDERHLKPLLDANQYSFEDIGNAHARLESGNAIGKVVVSLEK